MKRFVAGCAVWLALSAPLLLPGLQLGDRDTARLYYPVKKFFAEGLSRGELRFWDPFLEGGVSLLGQVTPGLLHPFTLLYFLPFDLAFALNHLLALFVGGLGVYWLCRMLGIGEWPALAGAFVFGGSGALVSAASSNLPYALGPATVPLSLAALFWFCARPSPLRLLAASALLASCGFAGDPQSMGLAILAGLAWAAVRRSLRPALSWAACGLLLSAPVALPAFVQLQRSARGEGVTARESASFSTAPVRLFGLVVGHAFDQQEPPEGKSASAVRIDTFDEYLSRGSRASFLASLLLGAPALIFAFAAGRRALFPLCAAAVLLAAATGDALGLQGLLAAVVPGWKYFRFAEKLVLPASWLLAVAAAAGLERATAVRRWAAGFFAASAILCAATWLGRGALTAALISVGRTHDPELAAQMASLLARGLLETAFLSLAVLLAVPSARLRQPIWIVACTLPAFLDPMLAPVDAALFHGRSSTGTKAIELLGPSQGRWRVWVNADAPLLVPGAASMEPHAARLLAAREALYPQLQALDGIEGLAPYFSAPDARFLAALRGAHEQLFSLFGVRLEVSREGKGEPQSDSGFFLHEREASPQAFVVHTARQAPAVDDAVAALRSIDVHAAALVDHGELHQPAGASTAAISRASAGRMTVQVQTATPGLLVLSERFDPGWSARVDGVAAEVVEVDLSALGVRVPEGAHEVVLRFFPKGLAPGLAIALATAAALVLWELFRRRRLAAPGPA
ncbi:MAG TPA: YfhO family protein [Myxococcales bacterium]